MILMGCAFRYAYMTYTVICDIFSIKFCKLICTCLKYQCRNRYVCYHLLCTLIVPDMFVCNFQGIGQCCIHLLIPPSLRVFQRITPSLFTTRKSRKMTIFYLFFTISPFQALIPPISRTLEYPSFESLSEASLLLLPLLQ